MDPETPRLKVSGTGPRLPPVTLNVVLVDAVAKAPAERLPSEESAREETEVSVAFALADDPAPAALELTGEPSRETWRVGTSTRLM